MVSWGIIMQILCNIYFFNKYMTSIKDIIIIDYKIS